MLLTERRRQTSRADLPAMTGFLKIASQRQWRRVTDEANYAGGYFEHSAKIADQRYKIAD
jgi:hypothetical protein